MALTPPKIFDNRFLRRGFAYGPFRDVTIDTLRSRTVGGIMDSIEISI